MTSSPDADRLSANRSANRFVQNRAPASSPASDDVEPSLRFVLRVVQELPWAEKLPSSRDVLNDARGREQPDHRELRRRLADFHNRDSRWDLFADAVDRAVLASYVRGEVDLHAAMKAIRRCGRAFGDTGALTGFVMRLRSTSAPKPWKGKHPKFPKWVRRVALTIVRILDRQHPGHLAPGHYTRWTSPTLADALAWLVTLGVFDRRTRITQRTLYTWCRDAGYAPASRRIF